MLVRDGRLPERLRCFNRNTLLSAIEGLAQRNNWPECIIGTQIYGRIGSGGIGRFRSQRVDPKGQKPVVVELGIVGEHIISGQIDVIPAQRGDLPQ